MLSILGLVALIILTIFTYRTAKDNGRNAVLWALAAFVVGFGLQIVVPIFIGIVIGIILVSSGTPVHELQTAVQTPAMIITIVCLILGVAAGFLILRQAAQLPEDKPFTPPPAPPTDFN